MKKVLGSCFLLFILLLPSCVGTGGVGSNDVQIFVVPFHSDSAVKTSSGRPYIRTKGSRQVCRWRPFNSRLVYEQLLKEGMSEEFLDSNFFYEGSLEPVTSEATEDSEVRKPVYLEVEDNWLKFGLQITNLTNYILVIDTIRLNGNARCGNYTFQPYSNEITTGYCSGEGEGTSPYLYLVLPSRSTGTQINYFPQSENPFDNLTLFFDGFDIIDRTGEASRDFQRSFLRTNPNQNTANNNSAVTNTANNIGGTASGNGTESSCQPDKAIVVPQYSIEMTLIGYFLLPDGEEQIRSFTKRLRFSTSVIN